MTPYASDGEGIVTVCSTRGQRKEVLCADTFMSLLTYVLFFDQMSGFALPFTLVITSFLTRNLKIHFEQCCVEVRLVLVFHSGTRDASFEE